MLRPEVLVGRAQDKFDATGRLTDDPTRKFLRKFLEQFASWIELQQRARDLALYDPITGAVPPREG
jgi:hypothetical protein